MESTAQYWRPVSATLERLWRPARLQDGGSGPLHLAQAQSNRGAARTEEGFSGCRAIWRTSAYLSLS